MAITDIKRDLAPAVCIVRMTTTNTLAEVGTTGYLALVAELAAVELINNGPFTWVATDVVLVSASDGWGFFTISADFESLDAIVFSTTVVGAPVVVGHFASFASTSGNIEDLGYLPSDPAKTSVVMAGSAVVVNHIAKFIDTAGTVDDTAGTAINSGSLQAGLSGTAGSLISFPASATSGTLRLVAANSAADVAGIITNASLGQAVTWTLADPAGAASKILQAPGSLVSGNLLSASGTAGLAADSGYPANGLQYASVAITAAQFNGMYAAPKLLVAAPGANLMLVVDSIQLVMTYVSANYAAGGVVAAQYDLTANGAGVAASTTEAAADFQAAASTVFKLNPSAVLAPFTTCANKGLYLSNITGAFTTGDSTFIAKVFYHTISTNS